MVQQPGLGLGQDGGPAYPCCLTHLLSSEGAGSRHQQRCQKDFRFCLLFAKPRSLGIEPHRPRKGSWLSASLGLQERSGR